MINQLKIKTRIFLSVIALAAGYVLFLLMVQWTSSQTHSEMQVASNALFPAALSAQEAAAGLQKLGKMYNDAILLQEKSALEDARKEGDVVSQDLENVKQRVAADPKLTEEVDSILTRSKDIQTRALSTYSAMIEAPDAMTEQVQSQVTKLARDRQELDASLTQLQKEITANFENHLKLVDAASTHLRIIGLGLFLLAIVACAGVMLIMQKQVILPLRHLAMRLQDIAEGEGDLTHRLEVKGNNEFDEVGKWFNLFVDRIEGLIQRVRKNSQMLASAATELSAAASEMSGRADQQQDQASRVSIAMSQISSAVTEVGETTNNAANSAREAEEQAQSGGQTVEQTVDTIRQVSEATREAAARIEELGKSSDAIGNIIRVIDDIANQTNLLALNAAIEAARAGEQGRGFAVVAGEVRRLAERTSAATKEIGDVIQNIQSETKRAVTSMRVGTERVEHGVERAKDAGTVLQSIIRGSSSVQQLISHIAAAATEQSASTAEVSSTMENIVQMVRETAVSAQQSVDASRELATLAEELNMLVGSFKVRETGYLSTPEPRGKNLAVSKRPRGLAAAAH
jgi:methyl-accepting chemotaxis protein